MKTSDMKCPHCKTQVQIVSDNKGRVYLSKETHIWTFNEINEVMGVGLNVAYEYDPEFNTPNVTKELLPWRKVKIFMDDDKELTFIAAVQDKLRIIHICKKEEVE